MTKYFNFTTKKHEENWHETQPNSIVTQTNCQKLRILLWQHKRHVEAVNRNLVRIGAEKGNRGSKTRLSLALAPCCSWDMLERRLDHFQASPAGSEQKTPLSSPRSYCSLAPSSWNWRSLHFSERTPWLLAKAPGELGVKSPLNRFLKFVFGCESEVCCPSPLTFLARNDDWGTWYLVVLIILELNVHSSSSRVITLHLTQPFEFWPERLGYHCRWTSAIGR